MEFLPWRDQVALGWRFARLAIWPPDVPLWGQFAYKAAQAAVIFGAFAGSWTIFGAGIVLATVLARITRS
jgi:hypothetical protein